MSSYSEKLKDPRWQKKRLQILERDGWKCSGCGDSDSTLNVHHIKYSKNPWDSIDEDLITLCCHCHEAIEFVVAYSSSHNRESFRNCKSVKFNQDSVWISVVIKSSDDQIFFYQNLHNKKTVVGYYEIGEFNKIINLIKNV